MGRCTGGRRKNPEILLILTLLGLIFCCDRKSLYQNEELVFSSDQICVEEAGARRWW